MAALLFIDAASYHEVCKKCNYLRRDSRLEFALSFAKRVPLEL